MATFTKSYLCKKCNAVATFKISLRLGTRDIEAAGSCINRHDWEVKWQVGTTPPPLPIKIGIEER